MWALFSFPSSGVGCCVKFSTTQAVYPWYGLLSVISFGTFFPLCDPWTLRHLQSINTFSVLQQDKTALVRNYWLTLIHWLENEPSCRQKANGKRRSTQEKCPSRYKYSEFEHVTSSVPSWLDAELRYLVYFTYKVSRELIATEGVTNWPLLWAG